MKEERILKTRTLETIGPWIFLLGVAITIILGLFPKALEAVGGAHANIAVLGILGIIVGLINITDKELDRYILANIGFLFAASSLMTVLQALSLGPVTTALLNIVKNAIYFVAPGLAVVCIRAIIEVSKSV
ncbi:MAG: hypothetical protein QXS37_02205 [Candidatus Aenigmatarchaeota archaeon]